MVVVPAFQMPDAQFALGIFFITGALPRLFFFNLQSSNAHGNSRQLGLSISDLGLNKAGPPPAPYRESQPILLNSILKIEPAGDRVIGSSSHFATECFSACAIF